jgi:FixJ family two-component response regulator
LAEPSVISVVDDDESFRDSMRRLLRSYGYVVAAFSSAAEFLASTQLPATACLVADVHMPAMTGVELCSRLLATGRAIPTILVSADPEDDVRDRMQDLGVRAYLSKPLDEAALIGSLRAALAERRDAPV